MMKKYLSIYLAATVIALGILLPFCISYKINVNKDLAVYAKDESLQKAHDAWLRTYNAAKYREELVSENQHSDKFGILWGSAIVDFDLDAAAWKQAGGQPVSGWWAADQGKIDIDRTNTRKYEYMLYIYFLLSVAYWIVIWGLVYKGKKPTAQD